MGANEASNWEEVLYSIGCRDSCMGWVNERAEQAESKLAELRAHMRTIPLDQFSDFVNRNADDIIQLKAERDQWREQALQAKILHEQRLRMEETATAPPVDALSQRLLDVLAEAATHLTLGYPHDAHMAIRKLFADLYAPEGKANG